MKILAIDPGLSCGYATYEGVPAELPFNPEDSGHIHFDVWDLHGNRFEGAGFRYIRLKNYLGELCKIEPLNFVYYEEVRKHLGTDAAHVYGAIIGAIQEFCELNKIPYCGIPTGTWKKKIIGKGNVNKDIVLEVIKKKFSLVTKYDEADAIGILLAALQIYHSK